MLTMSRSFPVSVAVSGKLPVHLCHCSQEWSSSRLRGLPDPSTILGLYLTTSHSCSETPRCCLGQAGPWCGGCVPWALGRGRMDLGMAQFPFQDNGVSPKKQHFSVCSS